MTEPADLTLQVLRQIRDEIIATRTDLGAHIHRVEAEVGRLRTDMNDGFAAVDQRFGVVEGALVDLATQQRFIVRTFDTLHRRDHRVEDRVETLEERVEEIEKKLAPR